MSTPFHIIVAVDLNFGIGKNGLLPWHLPADLKHFKEITMKTSSIEKQNAVIMGRKTWESLSEKFRPLPKRLNIVLTRDSSLHFPDGVVSVDSFEKALRLPKEAPWVTKIEKTFVIGGAEIFRQALQDSRCEKIYLTRILARYPCDTFLPDFRHQYKQTAISSQCEENSVKYYFAEFQRLP